eukprot:TRINITY_DN4460_c0_g1_i15.p1 TRINITY_DN4460_c0_g1~~TRINITY_DN4460_c0_g1_i15.p1  ORF type:complete len:395 (-),score=58.09 TRINITY_DN4460_c0_g1_i15:236-1420(-)
MLLWLYSGNSSEDGNMLSWSNRSNLSDAGNTLAWFDANSSKSGELVSWSNSSNSSVEAPLLSWFSGMNSSKNRDVLSWLNRSNLSERARMLLQLSSDNSSKGSKAMTWSSDDGETHAWFAPNSSNNENVLSWSNRSNLSDGGTVLSWSTSNASDNESMLLPLDIGSLSDDNMLSWNSTKVGKMLSWSNRSNLSNDGSLVWFSHGNSSEDGKMVSWSSKSNFSKDGTKLMWSSDDNSSEDGKTLSWSNSSSVRNLSHDGEMISWSNRSSSSDEHSGGVRRSSVLESWRDWSLAEGKNRASRFESEYRKFSGEVLSLFRSWIRSQPALTKILGSGLLTGSQVMSALTNDQGHDGQKLSRLFRAAGFDEANGDSLMDLIRKLFLQIGGGPAPSVDES